MYSSPRDVDVLHVNILYSEGTKIIVPRLKKLIRYTAANGKKNRGIAVIQSLMCLRGSEFSIFDKCNAFAGAAASELLQNCSLVMDDMMDQSLTRRGQPCWHTLPEIGRAAVNDGLMLEQAAYYILHNHIIEPPHIATQDSSLVYSVKNVFMSQVTNTVLGQMFDMEQEETTENLREAYTMSRYQNLAKWKTAYYTFCLPFHLSMILHGMDYTRHAAAFEFAHDMSMDFGVHFQTNDDILDCFGDPSVTGLFFFFLT